MIELKKVRYEYEEHAILKDFDLLIKEKSFYMILGRNGSGKSTLAKLISGITIPKEGKVFIEGLDTMTDDIWDIRKILGVIFQNPEDQFVGSTVFEDMSFVLENYNLKDIDSRIDEALEKVKLKHKKNEGIDNLSGGEQQKVAIATSLLLNPKILVLDESSSMLDPKSRKELLDLLKDLNEKGVTIVYITHFLEEIVYGTHCLLLEKGEKILEGTPLDFINQEDLIKKYNMVVPTHLRLLNKLNKKGYSFKLENSQEVVDKICQLI